MSEPLYILGAGSLGLLWAARCAQAGVACRVILRTEAARNAWQARHNRLTLERNGELSHLSVEAELAQDSSQPIAILIVATKAWAVADALKSIAHRLTADSQLVLLQNGLGSQQAASECFPQQRVLYASVTDGAWLREPNHVVWAGQGQTLLGDPNQAAQPRWLDILNQTSIDWQWCNDIMPVLWLKLAINCAINPITALHDCPNGQVPEYAGDTFLLLLDELHALLRSQNIELSREDLQERIVQVIQATASNSSSMRQDLHARRRTEIDFILGYACRNAHQAGIHTPVLDSLYQQLQQLLARQGLPQN